MFRTLLAIGVVIQVFAIACTKIDTPLSWRAGLFTLSCASLVGIGFVVAAGVKAPDRPAFRVFAFLGSVAGAVGWASWLLVALTSEKGDPVINITGLLCAVGWVLTACAVLIAVFGTKWQPSDSSRTWAWLFALLIIATEALNYAVYSVASLEGAGDWFWLTMLLPIVVGAAQIAVALRAKTDSVAKPLSITSGVVTLLPLVPALFAALISLIAAAIEFKSGRANRK